MIFGTGIFEMSSNYVNLIRLYHFGVNFNTLCNGGHAASFHQNSCSFKTNKLQGLILEAKSHNHLKKAWVRISRWNPLTIILLYFRPHNLRLGNKNPKGSNMRKITSPIGKHKFSLVSTIYSANKCLKAERYFAIKIIYSNVFESILQITHKWIKSLHWLT